MAKPDVVGVHEIAQRLGVTKSRVRQIVETKSFPDGTRLNMGWVWSVKDVEAWIAVHRPRPAAENEPPPGPQGT